MDVGTRGQVSVLCLLLLGGCVSVQTKGSESPELVHTWLLPSCPSDYMPLQSATNPASATAAFAVSELAVTAVGAVVDWLGSALEEAARVDREGKATLGTSATYLWRYEPKETNKINLMSCAVVALSASHPKNWCSETGSVFAKSAPAVCEYFKNPKSPASQQPSVAPGAWRDNKALPKLYAEIKLESAIDHRGILPKLATLYYPRGIHGGRFAGEKPRTLQISVAAATPEGASALSTVAVRLQGTKPVDEIVRGEAIEAEQGRVWVAALAIPEKYSFPKEAASIIPVNAVSEVREIGNPHAFLQALAAAFGKNKDKLKEALQAEAKAATSQTDPNALQSSYDQQAATVYATEASVRTACNVPPLNPSSVRSELLNLLDGHRKLAALPAPGKPITFDPSPEKLQNLHGQSAKSICAEF